MVPNLATPTQAFSIILIYFNSSFRCLLVRVSGNMKKRGDAVAGISFSFRFINFFLHCGRYRHCVWPIWFVADIVVSQPKLRLPGNSQIPLHILLSLDIFPCLSVATSRLLPLPGSSPMMFASARWRPSACSVTQYLSCWARSTSSQPTTRSTRSWTSVATTPSTSCCCLRRGMTATRHFSTLNNICQSASPVKIGPKMAVFRELRGVNVKFFFNPEKAHPCAEPRPLTYGYMTLPGPSVPGPPL